MSWRPEGTNPAHRLDHYAYRVAILSRTDSVVGYLLVLPDTYWRRLGGRLWWRRWGEPYVTAEVSTCLINESRTLHDDFYWGEDLDALVADWDAAEHEDDGVRYTVAWLDSAESRRLAGLHFGLDIDAERRRRRTQLA